MRQKEVKLYDFDGKLFKALDVPVIKGEFPDVITFGNRIFVASFSKYSYTERSVYQVDLKAELLALQSVAEQSKEAIPAPAPEKQPMSESPFDKLYK